MDASGAAFLAGFPSSADLPLRDSVGAQINLFGDGFAARFDPSGQLTWSTFTGGSTLAAAGPGGSVYLAGTTGAPDLAGQKALQQRVTGSLFRSTDGGRTWISGTPDEGGPGKPSQSSRERHASTERRVCRNRQRRRHGGNGTRRFPLRKPVPARTSWEPARANRAGT